MRNFINYTNHPSANWSEAQRQAAQLYGDIIDMDFPEIEPHWDEEQVASLACQQAEKIIAQKPVAVLVQGEFTFSYMLISLLLQADIKVLAACSQRCTESVINEKQETIRRSIFKFVRFRQYLSCELYSKEKYVKI